LIGKSLIVWQEQFSKNLATGSSSKMDIDNQLSYAYMCVDGMLAGQTALEDFVNIGEGSSSRFPVVRFCEYW